MPGSSPGMTSVILLPISLKTQSCSHSFPNGRSLVIFPRLLLGVVGVGVAVADAIDRAGPVVGNADRTVLGMDDMGGPAEIALVAFEPAGCEHILLGVLAVGTDGDAHDPRALIFMPVPRAVFGDQDRVLVLGGKLVAGIELHAERSHMRAEVKD